MESSTTELRKKMKNAASGEEKQGKDLISELPEPIILHILSFLDMKCVMATSFLSKRWRDLWMILTFLNFSHRVYDQYRDEIEAALDDDDDEVAQLRNWSGFADFIDRVLMLRDQSSKIQKISLFCEDFRHHRMLGPIYTWIHVLVRKSVEVIDLKIWSNYKDLTFPKCLFTCKTLTSLKLNMGEASPVFHLPCESRDHHLPALKFLQLTYVNIVDGIEHLISNAPILETLIFFNCTNCVDNQLTISALELKYLVIDSTFDTDDQLDYSCFKVFAPKLLSFSCKDFPINDYFFVDNNTSLVNATIEADASANYFFETDPPGLNVSWPSRRITYIQNMIKCLTGIHHVRNLTLSAKLLEILTEGFADLGRLPLDIFCNLRVLKLKSTLSKYEIRGILYLFTKCPQLETLEIEVLTKPSVVEKYVHWREQARECLMPNLKLIKIHGVLVNVNELDFLRCLLKNSINLEKTIVSNSEQQLLVTRKDLKFFLHWLVDFQAKSPRNVELLFLEIAKPWRPNRPFFRQFLQ